MADPRIIDSPKVIEEISFRELREMAYMGANVLHESAVFPVPKLISRSKSKYESTE